MGSVRQQQYERDTRTHARTRCMHDMHACMRAWMQRTSVRAAAHLGALDNGLAVLVDRGHLLQHQRVLNLVVLAACGQKRWRIGSGGVSKEALRVPGAWQSAQQHERRNSTAGRATDKPRVPHSKFLLV